MDRVNELQMFRLWLDAWDMLREEPAVVPWGLRWSMIKANGDENAEIWRYLKGPRG